MLQRDLPLLSPLSPSLHLISPPSPAPPPQMLDDPSIMTNGHLLRDRRCGFIFRHLSYWLAEGSDAARQVSMHIC